MWGGVVCRGRGSGVGGRGLGGGAGGRAGVGDIAARSVHSLWVCMSTNVILILILQMLSHLNLDLRMLDLQH